MPAPARRRSASSSCIAPGRSPPLGPLITAPPPPGRGAAAAGPPARGRPPLGEQLLHRAGAVSRLGRVDDGTSHLDFEPEEQKRRESLSLAAATFEHEGTRITLVHTPRHLP